MIKVGDKVRFLCEGKPEEGQCTVFHVFTTCLCVHLDWYDEHKDTLIEWQILDKKDEGLLWERV